MDEPDNDPFSEVNWSKQRDLSMSRSTEPPVAGQWFTGEGREMHLQCMDCAAQRLQDHPNSERNITIK